MSLDAVSRRRRFLLPALLLAGGVVLSGCSISSGGAGAEGAESSTSSGEATGGVQAPKSENDGGSARVTLPQSFPAEIPLPTGELVAAAEHNPDSGAHWVLQFEGDFTEADFASLTQELTERGYAEETRGGAEGQLLMAQHADAHYRVNLGLKWQNDGRMFQVSVSDLSGS